MCHTFSIQTASSPVSAPTTSEMASIASMRGEPGIVSIPGPGPVPVPSRRRGRRRTRAALAGCALLGAAAVLLRPGGEGNDARPGNRTARGLEAQRKPWVPVPSPPAERTSMPPVPSPPPAPVAGVRTALFFVPVEPNLRANNKMNSQHSLEHYSRGIERTCRFLADELGGYPTEVAGDVEFVREANGGGKCGGEGGGEHPMGLGELAHAEAAAAVQRHLCKRKMATDKHDARRILDGHVRVYLSRLEVLCDLAQRNPLELTVLVDADLDPALWDAVRDMIESRLADPSDSSLSAFSHADHNDPGGAGGVVDDDIDDDDGNGDGNGAAAPPPAPPASRRAWFGRPSCRVPPPRRHGLPRHPGEGLSRLAAPLPRRDQVQDRALASGSAPSRCRALPVLGRRDRPNRRGQGPARSWEAHPARPPQARALGR